MGNKDWSCLTCGRPPTQWIDGEPFCDRHKPKPQVKKRGRYSGRSVFYENNGYGEK